MRNCILVAAVFLIGAAPSPQRFDLECSDAVETVGEPVAPHVAHYRIDLAARKWCEDACRVRKPIADLQPTMILLERSDPPDDSFKHFIDREKGEDAIFSHRPSLSHTSGQCRRLPFSGFPTVKTEF